VGFVRQLCPLVALVVMLAGCTFPEISSPTPVPTAEPTLQSTPDPTATPTPEATPTPDPTTDPAAIPSFEGGEIIVTAIDGLRVRQRPGTGGMVVAGLLPLGSELEVVMGPLPVDGLGWYLVIDADPDEPEFTEGWIAAGYEPDAFLRSSGRFSPDPRTIASFALTGPAEYGPVAIDDEQHAIRWAAVDPQRTRCTFSVSLAAGSSPPIPAIRATIGGNVVPGTLQPGFFAAQPEIRGQVFLSVEGECAWTLAVNRVPAEPEPSPTSP
jgi:hypothetical protein